MNARFLPLTTRSLTLPNRVVVPPMASGTADSRGGVTAETVAHYRRLASSGAGLVFLEYTYVHASGRSEPHQLGLDRDDQVPALRRLVEELQGQGVRVGIQLTHCGGKGSPELAGGELVAPSAVPVPTRTGALPTPRGLEASEIPAFQQHFFAAAGRAVEAGFDVVELHAAHGYGLNQWLSPVTNHRTDGYGGDLAGRARMLLELVEGLRARHPSLALAVRIPGQDLLAGGLEVSDMQQVAAWLQARGLSLLDVSSGLGGWQRPRERRGQGYLVEEAARIQQVVSIPVIGVGGIRQGRWIDRALEAGRLRLAAVGRAILEDPAGFRRDVMVAGGPRR